MGKLRERLHRQVWQRIPRAPRRRALFTITSLLAPRPARSVAPVLPVTIVGALGTASGLGESARLCHQALRAAGLPVLGIDLSRGLMQPRDLPSAEFDGVGAEGPGVLILHVSSPQIPLALLRLGQNIVRSKYVVGYWAWELPRAPREWQYGVPFVHEIWVPSTFTADAIRPIAAGRSVYTVPYPVASNRACGVARARRAGEKFTVLTVFNAASSFERKNPLAAIAAFRIAFGGDRSARLLIKASNLAAFRPGEDRLREAIRGFDNISLIDSVVTANHLEELYVHSDVLISLHRSEGFGLTVAEAMLRGLPVVATNWSGNVDFLCPERGLPIPYCLVPANDAQGSYHHPDMVWADPDVEAAAAALRRLRREPELARRLGDAAAAFAAKTWSSEAYCAAALGHLGLTGSAVDSGPKPR
jgi:glycosyltransferase involved in cell wall biosynthesis